MDIWFSAIIVMAASIIFALLTKRNRFLELVAGVVRDIAHRQSIKINESLIRILAVIVFARAFSYCFYWAPFWIEGGIHDEASSWAPLCIDVWTVSGLVGGLLTVAFTKAERSIDRPASE